MERWQGRVLSQTYATDKSGAKGRNGLYLRCDHEVITHTHRIRQLPTRSATHANTVLEGPHVICCVSELLVREAAEIINILAETGDAHLRTVEPEDWVNGLTFIIQEEGPLKRMALSQIRSMSARKSST